MNAQQAGYGLYDVKNGKELKLAMQSLLLTGKVHSFGARLLVSHVLQSSEAEPIEAVYSFMLPRDGTLRRFYITGEGFSARSELKPTQKAEEEYEQGIEQGHLSALAKNYRDGVVNLNVGNIRPNETITVHLEIIGGVESHHNGFRFRFPFTLAPSYHAQAKMIDCGNGKGEIELPEDEFGDVILPPFMKDSSNLHKIGFNLNVDFPQESIELASPSHNIQTNHINDSLAKVSLSVQEDIPNRDLVLDVHTQKPETQLSQGIDKTGETSFICTIPASEFGQSSHESRNFVFLLDRSGSMRGTPMEQAKNALRACLSALSEKDRFSLIAFDTQIESFGSLVNGTMENRDQLDQFLNSIDARGGTELLQGIQAAASMLGDCQGDIMVITDGQVSGGEKIMQEAKALSKRLHILGIGAASQDRFISSLARETGGISKFLTPRERIDIAALELFSGIGRPVATEIKAELTGIKEGQIEPAVPAQAFESSSLQVFGHFKNESGAQLAIKWTNNSKEHEKVFSLEAEQNRNGNTLRLIRGARLITDLENMIPISYQQRSLERRQNRRINEKLASLSVEYELSSSEMALVSVVEREGDQAGKLPKTTVVPVGMPQGVEFGSYFGKKRVMHRMADSTITLNRFACNSVSLPSIALDSSDCRKPMSQFNTQFESFQDDAPACDVCGSICVRNGSTYRCFNCGSSMVHATHRTGMRKDFQKLIDRMESMQENTHDDLLVDLAAMIKPDGGMPGKSDENRILASIIVLLYFTKEGSTQDSGAFQSHVKKLICFIKNSMGKVPADYQASICHLLDDLNNDSISGKDIASHISDIENKSFTATADIWDAVFP